MNAARRLVARVAVGVLASVAAVSCGGDGDDPVLPLVDEIEPAIEAVESELGAGQQFFEVNATPQLVNLFVAGDGGTTATAYVYLDGELQDPAPPQEASGVTFAGGDVAFDADAVLDRVVDELDDPTVSQFVVLGTEGGAVRYEAIVTNDLGGALSVVVGPDGSVLSVDPL